MKDKINQIISEISKHRKEEFKNLKRSDKNLAVGLSQVTYDKKELNIWLTNKENLGGSITTRDIHNSTSGTAYIGQTTLNPKDGHPVYKNSKLGGIIISNKGGVQQYQTPKKYIDIEIHSLTSYTPDPHKKEASDIKLQIQPDNKIKLISSLLNYISLNPEESIKEQVEIRKIQEKISSSQENPSETNELIILKNKLEQKKKERETKLFHQQKIIRRAAELRYQSILDPWQEEIKRDNLFNKTISIDGGPGTGKTTMLIQRIKFLTDKKAMLGDSDNEGYCTNLNSIQKEKLFEKEKNWVFFTPNELLKLFLKNSMDSEGLSTNDDRVLIWKNHLKEIIKRYKIVNTETRNPFLFLRGKEYLNKNLLPYNASHLKKITNTFDAFFINQLNQSLIKSIDIDVNSFIHQNKDVRELANSIKNYLIKKTKLNSIDDLIRLFFNLEQNYNHKVKLVAKEYSKLLEDCALKLHIKINKNENLKSLIIEYIELWNKEKDTVVDENEEDDEGNLLQKLDIENILLARLKTLIKNYSLLKIDPTVKLSKKYKELLNLIETEITITELNKIGEIGFFNKNFGNISKGIESNIFNVIPKVYKNFRKEELKLKTNKWNFKILEHIINNDKYKNRRLHPNEQSFLIYVINKCIKSCFSFSKKEAEKINHNYFEAFKKLSFPVIGVDEASDFHIIDLIAIHSLSDLDVSSVSYSGDIMQRLTEGGIRKWKDLKTFIKAFEEKTLHISYRQSPTLLEIAGKINKYATGEEAEYMSNMEKNNNEPKPLLYENNNELEKIYWISERIIEIYNAYDRSIPSIAIFLENESEISEFADKLGELDELADIGISVKACNNGEVLGDRNTVRVFSIKYIKGMEFEAAIIHNIHKIKEHHSKQEMIMKSFYVALSRASFYLAITSNTNFEEISFLRSILETKELSWN